MLKNEQLRKLYERKWGKLSSELKKIVETQEIKPTHPIRFYCQ
jgi:hypothetical protein